MASSSTSRTLNSSKESNYAVISLSMGSEPNTISKKRQRKAKMEANKSQQPRFRFTLRSEPTAQQTPDKGLAEDEHPTAPVRWVKMTGDGKNGFQKPFNMVPHPNCAYTYCALIYSIFAYTPGFELNNAETFKHMTILLSRIFDVKQTYIDAMALAQCWAAVLSNPIAKQRFAKVSELYQYLFFVPHRHTSQWEVATKQLKHMLGCSESTPQMKKLGIMPNFLLLSEPTEMHEGVALPLLKNFGCDVGKGGYIRGPDFGHIANSEWPTAWKAGTCMNIFVAFVIFRPDILLDILKYDSNDFWKKFPVALMGDDYQTIGGEQGQLQNLYWSEVFDALKQIRRLSIISQTSSADFVLNQDDGVLKPQYTFDPVEDGTDAKLSCVFGGHQAQNARLTSHIFIWLCKRLGKNIPNMIYARFDVPMSDQRSPTNKTWRTFESFAFNNFADCIQEVAKIRPFDSEKVITCCIGPTLESKPNLQKALVTIAALHLGIDFGRNHPEPVFNHFTKLMKDIRAEHRIPAAEEQDDDVQFTKELSWEERDLLLRKKAIPIDCD